MDLGTYLRLLKFIRFIEPKLRIKVLGDSTAGNLYLLGTILNNVFPDGDVLGVHGDADSIISFLKFKPDFKVTGSIVRKIFYIQGHPLTEMNDKTDLV